MTSQVSRYMTTPEDASRFLRNHHDRWHDVLMASPDSSKRVPLGPTGELVAENVKRLRGSMQYKELAERLAAIERPIPALGLRRIEAQERRVDVDDLVALAIVFGVSPLTLMMPRDGAAELASPITGSPRPVAHNVQWLWATGEEPLVLPDRVEGEKNDRAKILFRTTAKPSIDERTTMVASFKQDGESDDSFTQRLLERLGQHLDAQGYGDEAGQRREFELWADKVGQIRARPRRPATVPAHGDD